MSDVNESFRAWFESTETSLELVDEQKWDYSKDMKQAFLAGHASAVFSSVNTDYVYENMLLKKNEEIRNLKSLALELVEALEGYRCGQEICEYGCAANETLDKHADAINSLREMTGRALKERV